MHTNLTTTEDADALDACEVSGSSPPGADALYDRWYDAAEWLAEQGKRPTPKVSDGYDQIVVDYARYLAAMPEDARNRAEAQKRQIVAAKMPEDVMLREAGFRYEPDLAAIMSGGIEPPERLIPNLIYDRRVHWIAGHPGHGKTTVAMWAARQVMEAGRDVVWIDWEAGTHPTAARLAAVGVSPQLAGERFHLVTSPPMEADAAGFEPIALALEEWPEAMIVFDSASKALSLAGKDENSPSEATAWTASIVMPARDHGGTVLVIDHVTKGATRSTAYARGAGSKAADTDVLWYVERTAEFNRERVGRIELHRHKDREGALPESIAFEVGDGRGGLPLTPVEVLDAGERESRRDMEVRGRVAAVLQEHSTPETKLSASQIEGLTTGKASAIREACKELANDPAEPYRSEPGARNSVLYYHDPAAETALSL